MNAHDYTVTVNNRNTCEVVEFHTENYHELDLIEGLLLFLGTDYSITAPDGSEYLGAPDEETES